MKERDSKFVDDRGRPRLADCAVLFVDVLGVRAMNRSRRAGQHLRELEAAVNGAYRDFLREDSPWPAAFFSDTLVLAAPVDAGGEEAAVTGLAVQAAWLQLDLVRRGFFVRGALTLGRFHIRGGLIFGPALVEAYELERDAAIYPRVVLGRRAEEAQRATLAPTSRGAMRQGQLLLRDDDGHAFVDYLGLPLEEPQDPTSVICAHRDTVTQRLREYRIERRTWEKYRWVAEYHNQVVQDRVRGGESLAVPASELVRRFVTFA
jgi:hypothetical protein